MRIFQTLLASVLLGIVVELGGIWHELHHIRLEQVKNALYALPQQRQDALRRTMAGKRLESTAHIDGDVAIDGDVNLTQPVEVEIDQ